MARTYVRRIPLSTSSSLSNEDIETVLGDDRVQLCLSKHVAIIANGYVLTESPASNLVQQQLLDTEFWQPLLRALHNALISGREHAEIIWMGASIKHIWPRARNRFAYGDKGFDDLLYSPEPYMLPVMPVPSERIITERRWFANYSDPYGYGLAKFLLPYVMARAKAVSAWTKHTARMGSQPLILKGDEYTTEDELRATARQLTAIDEISCIGLPKEWQINQFPITSALHNCTNS
jgi:hypothetical protein